MTMMTDWTLSSLVFFILIIVVINLLPSYLTLVASMLIKGAIKNILKISFCNLIIFTVVIRLTVLVYTQLLLLYFNLRNIRLSFNISYITTLVFPLLYIETFFDEIHFLAYKLMVIL